MTALMRASSFVRLIGLLLIGTPLSVRAQEPPPPIPHVVLDIRGTFPKFTQEEQLAASRGLQVAELPGRGLGGDAGLHVYVFRWKAVTFGLGAQVTLGRGTTSAEGTSVRAVTERFTSFTPQLSFNFGDGEGWSYISGGIGVSQRVIVPTGGEITEVDEERLRTVNYGGGARWFIKTHLAFTFDVRFHQIDPGTPHFGLPGSPRSTLFVMGAGVSLK
jgi:hypothetical protein